MGVDRRNGLGLGELVKVQVTEGHHLAGVQRMLVLVAVLVALKAALALLRLVVSTVALLTRHDDQIVLLSLVTVQTTSLTKTATLGAVGDLALVPLSREAAGNVVSVLLAETALDPQQIHLTLMSQMTGSDVASRASVKTLVSRVVVLVADIALLGRGLVCLGLDWRLLDRNMTVRLAVSRQAAGVGTDSTVLGEGDCIHIG